MKQINYIMVVKEVGENETWKEPMAEMVENDITPKQRANYIINFFNRSLRHGEKERELVSVIEFTDLKTFNTPVNHIWKKASLVTEKGGYDKYRCEVCGATGKRYGLNEGISIDARYKKRVNCPGKKK